MDKAKYTLAALALLAVASASTESWAQHRVSFLNPIGSTTANRSQPVRRVSARQMAHEPMLAAENGQPVMEDLTDSHLSAGMGDEVLSTDSMFMDGQPVYPSAVGGPEYYSDASDCGPCNDVCQPCVLDGWIQGEYLMWWLRPMQIPPLVTSGTVNSEGVLGAPGTQTLVGDQMLNQMYSGGRLRLGLWADPCHDSAWEFEGFVVGEVTDSYTYSGTGTPGSDVLARPFFNVLSSAAAPSGREDAELVALPGQLSGTVSVAATSQLYGIGVHHMRTICQSCGCSPTVIGCDCLPTQSRFMGFVGWRYLNLAEDLRINEDLTSLLPAPDNGQFLIEDRFKTGNTFNGVDLGVAWKACQGPYSIDLLMRLALGTNQQDVSIAGSTTLRGSGSSGNNFENATGGILAQRTNIGDYSRNQFAVVPELGVTLGYALSPQWRATVGYTFLYWSSVVRPGDQIDRDVNPNLFPPENSPFEGLERPVFAFVETDLWVNGLSLGLERTW